MGEQDQSDGLRRGNRIRITAGTFEGFEAVVTVVDQGAKKVSAEIHIFGKATPVELRLGEVERIPWRPAQ
jgi:transcription antitermination factor NusG